MNTRVLAREAVRKQISAAAFRLFTENGYDRTTIEAIASSVGMSARTFFRYFPAKEDVLMDHIHLFKASFLRRFSEHLTGNDIWEALKYALAELALRCAAPGAGAIQAFICKTPCLLARQLEIFEGLLLEATDLYLSHRSREADFSWHTANAILRCGFSCLQSVQAGKNENVPEEAFRELMAQMKPAILIKI